MEKLSRKDRRAHIKTHAQEPTAPVVAEENSFMQFMSKNYKILLLIPFIMLLTSLLIIGLQYQKTGDFVKRGISLKGGVQVTVTSDMADIASLDLVSLQKDLSLGFPEYGINVRELTDFGERTGVVFEAAFEDANLIDNLFAKIHELVPTVSINDLQDNLSTIGSSLSNDFFRTALIAILVAFAFMAFVVFISFRTFAPSMAVVLAAFSDIVCTLAIVNVLGIELSTAGVAAFLMLIGYSVDTDILLSTRVLKREDGTLNERIYGAMKTGMSMTITTLVAVTVGLFFATSDELRQIFTIVLIGLTVDIINTWLQNVGILRWYMKRRKQ